MTQENILLQPNEEITSIQGYEDLYSITNFGRVWSHERIKGRGGIYQGRWLKLCLNENGYLYLNIYLNGKRKTCKGHILTAQAFIENPNNLPEVNHKDGNKLNNFAGTKEKNYEDGNLEWVTSQENHNHAMINKLTHKKHSKFYGVSYSIRIKSPWVVMIKVNKKCKHVGCYKTEIEAAQAYNYYILEHKLNRPLNDIEGGGILN